MKSFTLFKQFSILILLFLLLIKKIKILKTDNPTIENQNKVEKILKLDNKKNIRTNIIECNKTLYLNTESILNE